MKVSVLTRAGVWWALASGLALGAVVSGWAASPQPVRPAGGDKKQLIAHRGASGYAPEHTLDAYRLALTQGADFVEQDLAVTKDGVLVCIHDLTLERTTNVEEVFPDRAVAGSAPAAPNKRWLVGDFTLAEIKRLDAGSWFDAKFAGARIPTFQEAIDVVARQGRAVPRAEGPGVLPRSRRPPRGAAGGGARRRTGSSAIRRPR